MSPIEPATCLATSSQLGRPRGHRELDRGVAGARSVGPRGGVRVEPAGVRPLRAPGRVTRTSRRRDGADARCCGPYRRGQGVRRRRRPRPAHTGARGRRSVERGADVRPRAGPRASRRGSSRSRCRACRLRYGPGTRQSWPSTCSRAVDRTLRKRWCTRPRPPPLLPATVPRRSRRSPRGSRLAYMNGAFQDTLAGGATAAPIESRDDQEINSWLTDRWHAELLLSVDQFDAPHSWASMAWPRLNSTATCQR